jgi:Tfp pilus assembly protein PilF
VRYSGDRVRITTNLIDVATGASRWSEVYDRELGDVFAIQEDIATNIAAALGTQFPRPQNATGAGGQATKSPEAAALYLKVVSLQRQVSYDVENQHRLLDSALAFDPGFASAYAMKATLYATSVVDLPEDTALREHAVLEELALENAAKALELDSASTQAYLAVAAVHRNFWRWGDAIDAFEKAYALSPNDVDVLREFGLVLAWAGRHERAVRMHERAAQIDPQSPASHWYLGVAFAEAGRTASALSLLRAAAARTPTVPAVRVTLGRMEALSGNRERALAEFQAAERLLVPWSNPTLAVGMLYSYSLIGGSEDVQRLASVVRAMEGTGQVGAGSWTLMYLALGDVEQAHHWLTVAVDKVERHEPDAGFLSLMAVKTNLYRNPVLEEPRFRALRDRIGVLD